MAPLNMLTRERGASHVKGSLEKTSTLLGSFGSTELQRKLSYLDIFICGLMKKCVVLIVKDRKKEMFDFVGNQNISLLKDLYSCLFYLYI